MKRLLARLTQSVAALTMISACGGDPASAPARPKLITNVRSALLDATGLRADAQAGVFRRGEQDLMMRLEASIPGFGGLYLTANGISVYVKETGIPDANIRAALASFYAKHPNPLVRETMADVKNATVLHGAYALSELVAIENRIVESSGQLAGLHGVGANLRRNRVDVAFTDSASMSLALARMASIGVPPEAIQGRVMAPMKLQALFSSRIRPTRSGLQIGIGNKSVTGTTPDGVPEGWCSIGYNVRIAGVDYVMTTAHCANLLGQTARNGPIGDSIFQPNRSGGLIGRVDINPLWDTTVGPDCPINGITGNRYDYCTNADVLLARTSVGERKMTTSMYGGVNGGVGSPDINGYYPINGVYTPEYARDTMRNDGGKSGSRTGTTSGPIAYPIWS